MDMRKCSKAVEREREREREREPIERKRENR